MDMKRIAFNKALKKGKFDKKFNLNIELIKLENLYENPYQPRMDINEKEIEELANSIKENGLMQPILVYEFESDKFYIIAGHRRAEALKFLGKKNIKAIISKDEDDIKLAEKSIVENLQRKDLNILELAIAIDRYKKDFNKTIEESARKFGKTKDYVSRLLKVLELPEEILEDLRKNKSTKDVKVLATINSISKKLVSPTFDESKLNELQICLYFGFLEKGEKWLRSGLKQLLSKKNENIKPVFVAKRVGKKKAIFTIKLKDREFSEEMIKKIESLLLEVVKENQERR